MITRRYKGKVVFQPYQMVTNRNDVLKKGKALILALPDTERKAIFNQLDVHDKVLFNRVANFCYATN